MQCIYCSGYGHKHTDYVERKISKADFVVDNKKKFKKRKYCYERVETQCETKLEFEASLQGF